MKVLFAAAEGGPFYKTGGLGDVMESLPKALLEEGVDVRIVLPYYKSMPNKYKSDIKDVDHFYITLGSNSAYCGIKQLDLDGITYYFIDNESYFYRDNLYGYWDDGERFAFFSMAVIEIMEKIDFVPDIIHIHDWHVAMIPVLLEYKYKWIAAYKNIRKVLTIHNLKFQGVYDPIILDTVFDIGYDAYHNNGLRHFDQVNYLKSGIHYSDRVTTVSPSYAQEIQSFEFGEHLDGDLVYNNWKLSGILNGISQSTFDPKKDPLIDYNLKTSVPRFKHENKVKLQNQIGLSVDKDVALIGVVTRLTDQKGINLIIEAMEEISHRNVQLVVLGTGDKKYEDALANFSAKYPSQVRTLLQFDIQLAQKIYAASDIFLMPSAFEPCGLSQLIAYRYGSIPLVHETGGLRDTVEPYNVITHEGTGFSFNTFSSDAMLEVLDLALVLYYDDKKSWRSLTEKVVNLDYSWKRSVRKYIELYEELMHN